MNMMASKWEKCTYLLLSVILLNGCAAVAGPNPNDPYESYNYRMFQFNEKADQYVIRPIAKGYEKVTPKPVRKAINNFFDNLRDVVSMGSNLLRGHVGEAGYDFMRVAVNTTLGVGGLVNIADEAGMPNHKNTLGDTFAAWGWKNSHYLVYPLKGPSTVRDSIGDTITYVYPIENTIIHDKIARYSTTALKAVDKRAELLSLTDTMDKMNTMDKYTYIREVFMAKRNHDLGIQTKTDDDVNIDDLLESDDNGLNNQTNIKVDNSTSGNSVSLLSPTSEHSTVLSTKKPKLKHKMKAHLIDPDLNMTGYIDENPNDVLLFSQQIWQYRSSE